MEICMRAPFGRLCLLVSLCLSPVASLRAQLNFTFDYSLDTGFFSGANEGRRLHLEAVGSYVSQFLTATSLAGITAGGGNTWTAQFTSPSSPSTTHSVTDLSVAANTVVVYVGGAGLGGSVLAQAILPGISASGEQGWVNNTVLKRTAGDSVYTRASVAALSFNSSTAWFFDSTPLASSNFAGQFDFFSVAAHELLHVLGFGDTRGGSGWDRNLFNGAFAGGKSLEEKSDTPFGVPLNAGRDHWAANTLSFSTRDGAVQETLMDPDIAAGVRKYVTSLDLRALNDIGYAAMLTAVPEPAAFALGTGVLCLVWAWRRRGRRDQS
jgi:hypothetical protein